VRNRRVSLVPEVSVVVKPRVVVQEDLDPVAIAQAVTEARRGARVLFKEVLPLVDERSTETSGGFRQRLEQRWVATTLRARADLALRVRNSSGSFHPLDRCLGLSSDPRAFSCGILQVLWWPICSPVRRWQISATCR
jgi:hypothetical protein